jgi:hypothetical protein
MPDAVTTNASNDIPPLHWSGAPLDCGICPHNALRALGPEAGCEAGRSCMQDAYARRIDRFFRHHRELAAQHLAHPYFEVRAIAARYCDVFHLGPLMDDVDETVRLQVALRVPQRLLKRMVDDPHREVRIRVAQRIDEGELGSLLRDTDYEVRKVVARRVAPALLPLLLHDGDAQVRCEVARRMPMPALWRMVEDPEPEVRRLVAERLPAPLLGSLAADPDWLVRWHVAARAPAELALRLARDEEGEVRDQAHARLLALGRMSPVPLNPVPPGPHALETQHG